MVEIIRRATTLTTPHRVVDCPTVSGECCLGRVPTGLRGNRIEWLSDRVAIGSNGYCMTNVVRRIRTTFSSPYASRICADSSSRILVFEPGSIRSENDWAER